MRKSNALKYIICTLTFVVSFFMLFNSKVSAANVNYEVRENVFLELAEINDEYSVVGGYHTCGSDEACLESIKGDLVIPDTYNNKKVVSIADAKDSFSVGVLDELKEVVTGTVRIGNNVQTIGLRAFYQFSHLKKVVVSSSVTLIKNYAFDESGVEIVEINRYGNSDVASTNLESTLSFSGMAHLSRIVFPTSTILNFYRTEVANYKNLEADIISKFTYKVTYVYHNDDTSCDKTTCREQFYYFGDTVTVFDAPTKAGFDFVKWNSVGGEVKTGSKVTTGNSTYSVIAEWKLKDPIVTMATYYKGNPVNNNQMAYAGKNEFLEIRVDVDHELQEEYKVKYTWIKHGALIDTILSEKSDINSHKIRYVGESATYSCIVEIIYIEDMYESSKTVSIRADIVKRTINIYVNGNETEYGTYVGAKLENGTYFKLDDKTPLAEGETIKSATAPLYTGENNDDLKANVYEDVLVLENLNIGYEDSTDNYIENYHIEWDYGDLTIVKKNIPINLKENIVFEYGEDIGDDLSLEYEDENVYGNSKILIISYNVKDFDEKVAGEYEIGSITVNDPNYIATFSTDSVAVVVIKPKVVEVDWDIEDDLIYSGNEKSISASFKGIDKTYELGVNVTKGGTSAKFVNAGEYELVAFMKVYNPNYTLENSKITKKILKAESKFIDGGSNTQTKPYNGVSQKVDISLNHNEAEISYSDYRSCKNAQTKTQNLCAIEVSVPETENYTDKHAVYYLKITPILLEIEPQSFEIPYGTAIGIHNLNQLFQGINNEQVLVFYTKEGNSTSVGSYNIGSAHVSETNNYEVDIVEGGKINKINIIPAEVEVKFFIFDDLAYDGNVKEVEIHVSGTTEELGLLVDYNGKSIAKNAGKYRIDVSLANKNYTIKGKDYFEFEIAKANYNVKNLSLKDKKVKYDFNSHSIVLNGELPEGLTANYTIDGEKGNGTYLPFKHTVKVTFEGDFLNYNYIEPLEATLYIDMTWVFVVIGVFVTLTTLLIVGFILLVKYEIIKITDKEQRRRLRRAVRKNKAILAINEMFKENKKRLVPEEEIIIEQDVSFVKNLVESKGATAISLSFVDKLFKSDISTKEYYSEVKNELLSYEGIVSKIKRDYETFYVNNIPVAKLDVIDGVLELYLALDPTQYKAEEYKHTNVSAQKDFVAVPLKLIVKNIESLRHAKMFIRIIRKREKLKFASNFIRIDYVNVYTAKDNAIRLFKKKKVKKGSKESLED